MFSIITSILVDKLMSMVKIIKIHLSFNLSARAIKCYWRGWCGMRAERDIPRVIFFNIYNNTVYEYYVLPYV